MMVPMVVIVGGGVVVEEEEEEATPSAAGVVLVLVVDIVVIVVIPCLPTFCRSYESSKLYRDLKLRGSIIRENQLVLLPHEEQYNKVS